MPIRDGLLTEFDHEVATTRKLLERLPDAKLAWKPHEKSMSLGGLGTHLSHIPRWSGAILNESSFDMATPGDNDARDATDPSVPGLQEKTSRAGILAAFDEATARTRQWMDKSDAEYAAPWMLKREGQEVFTVPRVAAFRSFVLNHLIHHRGQLSVYLRLNDIPVPSIYGPSADEGSF